MLNRLSRDDQDTFIARVSRRFIHTDLSLYDQILCACSCDHPVLILGPTGTGKELIATTIRESELWTDKPFEAVNCALIPREHLYAVNGGLHGWIGINPSH